MDAVDSASQRPEAPVDDLRRFVGWVDDVHDLATAATYADGACVAALHVGLVGRRAILLPAEHLGLEADPGLVDAVCGWAARHGARDAILQIGDHSPLSTHPSGFTPRASYLTLGRRLGPADRRAPAHAEVHAVAPDDQDVARLVRAQLPADPTGRPSGAEILALLRRADSVRAWARGHPAQACFITQRVGTTAHLAVAVREPRSQGDLMGDLVRTAFADLVAGGVERVEAFVATTNQPSRRLCERFGLRPRGGGTWWHRPLRPRAHDATG
jgi:hypothetical protein